MAQKQMGRRRANGIALTHIHKPLPSDIVEYTTVPDLFQGSLAVSRLSRRFGLPPSTALAVAEANAWGCR